MSQQPCTPRLQVTAVQLAIIAACRAGKSVKPLVVYYDKSTHLDLRWPKDVSAEDPDLVSSFDW